MARETTASTLSPAMASLDHSPLSGEYYTSTKYRVRSYYTRNYSKYGYY